MRRGAADVPGGGSGADGAPIPGWEQIPGQRLKVQIHRSPKGKRWRHLEAEIKEVLRRAADVGEGEDSEYGPELRGMDCQKIRGAGKAGWRGILMLAAQPYG